MGTVIKQKNDNHRFSGKPESLFVTNEPPEKIVMHGVVYKRELKTYEKTALNQQDKIIIEKAAKIKYSPPFSYRWIKIFSLLTLVIPFLLFRILIALPDFNENIIDNLLDIANVMSLPLIIFAAFLVIFKAKNKLRLVVNYAIAAFGIYLMLVFIFERYLVPLIANVNPELTYAEARTLASKEAATWKFFQYNIFIDLLLCVCFHCFMNVTPKCFANSPKKLKAFRLCAIIPVIYVIVSIILSALLHNKVITLSIEIVGLLICRSPASYAIFFGMSLFLAFSQHLYLKKGGSVAGFEEYKKSTVFSLQFSVVTSVIIAVVCLLDFLLEFIPGAEILGIGNSKLMFVIIPFIMLVSFTKDYKNQTIDIFLPIVVVASIIFLSVDSAFAIFVE